jgi:exosortase
MDNAANSSAPTPATPAGSAAAPASSGPTRVVWVATLDKITGCLLALGCITLVVVYFDNLWTKEYYQFYPLALAGVGFLAWTGWKSAAKPLETGVGWLTVVWLAIAFTCLGAATFLWSGWLGMIGTFALALGVVWWLGGWNLTKALLPAGIMGLTVMRPPMDLDGRLTMKLQALATKWSSVALDGFGVTHALSGNVIEIPKQRLMVEEACSGINSILSTTAVCLFFCLWQRRNIFHIVVMLAMTVGFVLLGNVTRIVSGAWLRYEYDFDILSGWKHETVGLILFASYLGLILSADKLLLFLFGPGRKPAEDRIPVPPPAPAPAPPPKLELRRGPRWPAYAAGAAFGLLGLAQLGQGVLELKQTITHASINEQVIPSLEMPSELAGWRRVDTAGDGPHKIEISGIRSQAWHYRRGADIATIALDYPFKGYHDVTICYTGNGWEVFGKRTRLAAESPDGAPCVEVKLQKSMGARASLWFATLDQRGNWVDGSFVGRTLAERFREKTSSTTYRVQVLVTSFLPLTPEAEESVGALFREARGILSQQLMAELRKN